MRLSASGREYATLPVGGALADVDLDVSFDGGTTWHRADRPSDSAARVLVAGPTATGNPPGTAVLRMGRNPLAVRLSSSPEVVIREAGTIYVFALDK
jgi:hypothetical protein